MYYETSDDSSVDSDGVSSLDSRSVDVPSVRSGELLKASGFPDRSSSELEVPPLARYDPGEDSSVDKDGLDLPGGGDALPPAPAVVAWPVAGAPTEPDMPPSSSDASLATENPQNGTGLCCSYTSLLHGVCTGPINWNCRTGVF